MVEPKVTVTGKHKHRNTKSIERQKQIFCEKFALSPVYF